jgi:hypothetical protein
MNEIERHTLTLIGENPDSPDVFVEGTEDFDQIRDSIYNAIEELSISTGSFMKTYHLALLPGRSIYRLRFTHDHFLYVLEAWDRKNHRKLYQTSVKTLDRTDPRWLKWTGYPTHYAHIGSDAVLIYRTPTATGQVIELRCVAVPKQYASDTDPIKLREAYRRAAAYYAASEYYASRGDAKRAEKYHEEYLMLAGLKKFTQDTPEAVHRTKGRRHADFSQRLD